MRRSQFLRNGLLLLVTALANGKLYIGTLRSPSCFEPIAKFAYDTSAGDSEDGRFHARVQFRQGDYRDLHLVTYNQDEWRRVYKSRLTCAQRLDIAKLGGRSKDHMVVPVYENFMEHIRYKRYWEDNFCTDGTIHFDRRYSIRDPATNWFYVALINANPLKCNQTLGVRCQGPLMNISYRFNFRNMHYTGALDALPANKIGLVYITIINLVASLALVIIGIFVGCKLKQVDEYHYIIEAASIKRKMVTTRKLLQSNEIIEMFKLPSETLVSKAKHVKSKCHVTVKGLIASILCYFTANLFWFMHYMVITGNGLELEVENIFTGGKIKILYVIGELCWLLSDFFMAILGIVLAKGWTLVRRKLSVRSRAIYGMLLSIYIFMGAGAIFWNLAFYTDYDAVDFYDSLPAAMLVGVRALLFLGFIWAIFTTIRSFKIKRNFFIKFAIFYGLWFISLGVFAGIVNLASKAFLRREAIMHCTTSFCILLAQYLLIFMYWPGLKCCLARRFPFHADVDDMLNPAFHHALDIIKSNANMTPKEISAKIRAEGVDPLSKVQAIMKEMQDRLEMLEGNEVDLRCAFEELEDEEERQDDMGEDLGSEKRAPKLHAFGYEDYAAMAEEHERNQSDRSH